MPSLYCQQNPNSSICQVNPNYGTFGGGGGVSEGNPPFYFPTNIPTSNPRIPQVIATSGGITAYPDKLSTILNSILSGLAIIKGAKQVPTTVSGDDYNSGLDARTLALLQSQQFQGGGGNTAGKVEAWIKNNTGVTLMAVVAVALYLTKSPRKG